MIANERTTQLKLQGIWKRWIWPNIQVLALEKAISEVNELHRVVESAAAMHAENDHISFEALASKFGKVGVIRPQIFSYLESKTVERHQKEAEFRAKIEESYQRVAQERKSAFDQLSSEMAEIQNEAEINMQPLVQELNINIERVKREQDKLNISPKIMAK